MTAFNQVRRDMTPERRAEFLRVFRECGGNWAAAARRVAHPDASVEQVRSKYPPAMSSFRALATRDPEFGAAIQEILQDCRDDVEREIMRRGQEGWNEPIFQKGERVIDVDGTPAVVRKYSDNLLLARARALMPDKYADRKNVAISGHVSVGPAGRLEITSADLGALSETERKTLTGLLVTIRDARRDGGDVPQIEYQPAEMIDTDFEEIEDGNTLANLNRLEASE